MKFMKLGSRPDTLYTTEGVRSVSSEVASDLMIQVKGSRYLLHKFPLLSKCLRLQRACAESPEALQVQIVQLPDFPGGVEAFELCAKFCYGITITLSAYNIVSIRCAAEYLEMTQDVEKGNLIYKIEVFFNSCILHGWRDTIVTLQSTKAFPLWGEDLGIPSRCIQGIASKVLAHPTKVSLSHRGRGWWAQDLAELGIDLYWRTMIAIKSGGKVPSNLIGDALRIYASRWLPNSDSIGEMTWKHRLLLESIISLLPCEKGQVSCSFLLKLLKAANILKASSSSKMELATRIGLQLEEASVGDLLIPSLENNDMIYDVGVVITILEHFMLQGQCPRRSLSAENVDLMFQESRRSSSASHSSKVKVAKLVDGYLEKIAKDKNLPLSNFIAVAEAIPEFARLDHDHLYKAIDIYLKGHPELNKSERKRVCRILDCKRLSVEACKHAAQNEMLPLRVVVQVLFSRDLPSNIKALLAKNQWSSVSSLNSNVPSMKLDEDDNFPQKSSNFTMTPKRMFTKFWPINTSTT